MKKESKSNARLRQRIFREKMREQGYINLRVWIKEQNKELILRLIKHVIKDGTYTIIEGKELRCININ